MRMGYHDINGTIGTITETDDWEMIQGTRSAILKLTAIIVIVIAVDQTLREQILQSPGREK